jgi:hypothetical protein
MLCDWLNNSATEKLVASIFRVVDCNSAANRQNRYSGVRRTEARAAKGSVADAATARVVL